MPEVLDAPTSTEPSTDAQQAPNAVNKPQPYRPKKTDKAIVETAKALYFQGNQPKAIAAQLNLNPSTVRYWSFSQRWPELASKAKQITQLTDGKRPVSVSVSVASPPPTAQSDRLRAALAREIDLQVAALAEVPPEVKDLPNTPQRQGRAAVLKTIVDAASVIHDWDSQRTPGIIVIGDVERAIDASEDATPIDIDSRVEQVTDAPEPTTGGVPPEPSALT